MQKLSTSQLELIFAGITEIQLCSHINTTQSQTDHASSVIVLILSKIASILWSRNSKEIPLPNHPIDRHQIPV